MNGTLKRTLSAFCACAMLATASPLLASAADGDTTTPNDDTTITDDTTQRKPDDTTDNNPDDTTNIPDDANSTNKGPATYNSSEFGKIYPRLDKTIGAYLSGYSDGTIRPNANLTRAEAASLFYRLVNASTSSAYHATNNQFHDVSDTYWANETISTLSKAGVLKGYEDGTFRPEATITRAELVSIITRLESASTTGQAMLTDVEDHWAMDAIINACNWGVTTGYPDGTFRPDESITRAEAVAMINRVMAKNVSFGALKSDMKTFTDNTDPLAWYYVDLQIATN